MANIIIAYMFWIIGGPLGLHHFYLGRDRHALLWWMSLGGLFLGWFRDSWMMHDYLKEANREIDFLKRKRRHPKPPWEVVRFAGQLLIGTLFGYLFRLAIPEFVLDELDFNMAKTLSLILPILGSATGVCLVANIGIQTVAFKWCLLGAAVSTPALLMKDQSIIFAALFSSLSASWKTKWNIEKKPRKGFLKRCVVLTFCGMLYLSLWTDVIYFNLHVTTSDGKKVPVNQVVNDFVESSAWKSLKKNMYDLYEHCQQDWKDCRNTVYELFEHCQKLGWLKCYDHLVHHLHPTEGTSAYKVLWWDHPASLEEIQQRCDLLNSNHRKEIQTACDTLIKMQTRRVEYNKKSESIGRSPPTKTTEEGAFTFFTLCRSNSFRILIIIVSLACLLNLTLHI